MKQLLANTDKENAVKSDSGADWFGSPSIGSTSRLQLTVRFKVGDGPEQFTLSKNQTISVGGSHAADVVLPLAALMPQQFMLSTRKGVPSVTALAKKPPLSVNGQSVQQSHLVDGDLVEVGEATFHISIVGGQIVPAEKTDAAAQIVGAAATGAICGSTITPKSEPTIYFETKQHANGVFETLVSRDAEPAKGMWPVSNLIRAMSGQLDSLIILNRSKMGEDFKAVPTKSKPLFEGLPGENSTVSTPVLIDPKTVELKSFYEKTWGKDAVVTVLWDADEAAPYDELYRCAGFFHCPSTLRSQLVNASDNTVEDLMLEIDLIAMESETTDGLKIYSMEDPGERLDNANWRPLNSGTDQKEEH